MGEVFIGSEAMAKGTVTEYELRRWHRAIFPDVYIARSYEPSLRDRTVGAWLWSRRRGVIAGVAASALHGAPWVDTDTPIEIVLSNSRRHSGLVVRSETLVEAEITKVAGIPVTTVARTAFDLGRHLPRGQAVARLDALTWATSLSTEEVVLLAQHRVGARGIRKLRRVLPLVDGGAASPKETWLRLLLVDAGFPVPATQIPVHRNHQLVGVLDMGWAQYKVAVEYDGDQHRTNRHQYVKDIWRIRTLESLGWIVIRVVVEDRPTDIIKRVDGALSQRGFRRNLR